MSVDPIISLQVGERHFTTLKSTLEEGSTFFRALLAEEWQGSRSPDGSYFIDADPDLFVYSLRYLRRGVFPLFYNATHGFDFALYHALQEEALYFGIENLYNWIKDQKYAQAVQIQYTLDEIKGEGVSAIDHFTALDGTSDRSYHPAWGTEKVYQCPRSIFLHMGNPNACGRAYDKARGDEGDIYRSGNLEDPYYHQENSIHWGIIMRPFFRRAMLTWDTLMPFSPSGKISEFLFQTTYCPASSPQIANLYLRGRVRNIIREMCGGYQRHPPSLKFSMTI